MESHETTRGLHVPHSNKREIYYAAIVLTLLTALEFLIAFTMDSGTARTLIFLFLTFLKAFYIIAYFMHLKHEKLHLMYSIIIPFLFIFYMIALLIYEGIK